MLSYEEYHPFGTTAYARRAKRRCRSPTRYRYTGMERDEESGLSYHGSRYYAPWMGGGNGATPSGSSGGLNGYAYVRNRPTSLTDPTGNADEEQAQGWGEWFASFVVPEGDPLRELRAPWHRDGR